MSILYMMRFGSAGATFTTPSFAAAAITKLEAIGSGRFKVQWNAATGTVTHYNIYVKLTTGGTYPATPFTAAGTATKTVISHLNTDLDPLVDGADYTVKVTAMNGTQESTNTDSLNNIVYGGSNNIQIKQVAGQ